MAELQSEESRQLLDTVDKLRSLNIQHTIDLPQIIVVGQQSSGKSSVLSAISGIEFPSKQETCTRFATEVILRRSEHAHSRASIQLHDPNPSEQKLKDLQTFADRWTNMDLKDMPEIIESANQFVSVSDKRRICKDRLRLELSGPGLSHLTLIDLPGLIASTLGHTNSSDIADIDQLVVDYMRSENTIILAVATCSTDFSNQGVFEKLKSAEYRKKMLGVITGPDKIEKNSPRLDTVLELLRGQTASVEHNWHIVRNLSNSEREEPGVDRDAVENDFFLSKPWTDIDSSRLGITSLRERLTDLLTRKIATELPKIREKLDYAIGKCNTELDHLGDERSTPGKQRIFLLGRARSYEKAVCDTLQGGPKAELGQDRDIPSLRATITKMNEDFMYELREKGHTWQLNNTLEQMDIALVRELIRSPSDTPFEVHGSSLSSFVFNELKHQRTRTLPGTTDHRWITYIFKRQAQKWRSMAIKHVKSVFIETAACIQHLVLQTAGIEAGQRLNYHVISPFMLKREKELLMKVDELVSPYQLDTVWTNNKYYKGLVDQYSLETIKSLSKNLKDEHVKWWTEIYAPMHAWYGIALETFADNCEALAIENCLLRDLHKIIEPEMFGDMSDELLELLGGERPEVVQKRAKHVALKGQLEKARAILTSVGFGDTQWSSTRAGLGHKAVPNIALHPAPFTPIPHRRASSQASRKVEHTAIKTSSLFGASQGVLSNTGDNGSKSTMAATGKPTNNTEQVPQVPSFASRPSSFEFRNFTNPDLVVSRPVSGSNSSDSSGPLVPSLHSPAKSDLSSGSLSSFSSGGSPDNKSTGPRMPSRPLFGNPFVASSTPTSSGTPLFGVISGSSPASSDFGFGDPEPGFGVKEKKSRVKPTKNRRTPSSPETEV